MPGCGRSVSVAISDSPYRHSQVARNIGFGADGELQIHRLLSPYESPDIPEAFLVVRT